MTKTNYKAEYKRAKQQISELQNQITTLKDRLDVLRKAKNQTILKTEIVNRNISEPIFGQGPLINEYCEPVKPRDCTTTTGVNTEPVLFHSTDPPRAPPTPSPPSPTKRAQRRRVKDACSQCHVYTANKVSQVEFVQTCHCEGFNDLHVEIKTKADPVAPCKSKTPVTFPKIATPCSAVGVSASPVGDLRTLSRMKTNEYISSESHAAEIAALEAAFKAEREKQISIHSRETMALKHTIGQLTDSLKCALEDNVRQTINAPNGASVFHLYAEEKKRMEDQVRHINQENHKLRNRLKKLAQELKDKEEEMEESEESFKKHYVETWDEQYRSWISKTEAKMNFLRNSNENMQNFIMKNARHLPFAATDELKIYNEYGEKVSVFQ